MMNHFTELIRPSQIKTPEFYGIALSAILKPNQSTLIPLQFPLRVSI